MMDGDGNSNSRSSRTRGRIATVLAQARATLKEPSRPVTPASLDARLDLIPGSTPFLSSSYNISGGTSHDNNLKGSGASSSSNKIDSYLYSKAATKKKTSSNTATILTGGIRNQSSTNNNSGARAKKKSSTTTEEHFTFDQDNYEDDNGDISYYDGVSEVGLHSEFTAVTSNTRGSGSSNNNTSHGDIGLLLLDIEDSISVIAGELQQAVLEPNMMTQLLGNMASPIDKFTKYMKSIKFKQNKELYDKLIETLASILEATQVKSLRQQTCKHILRLLLVKYPVRHVVTFDARVLLRTTRDLYLCASEEGEDRDSSSDAFDYNIDSTHSSLHNDQLSSSSSTSSVLPLDNIMVQGGIDQILEFLGIVWVQAEAMFKSRDGFHSDADQSYNPVREGEKLYGNVGAFKMFLEAGVYAAGIIRIYSVRETNRRRLFHIGAVAGLSDGLRTVLKVIVNHKKEQEAVKEQVASGNSSVLLSKAAAKRDEAIAISQMGYIVVQIISTIRNFTLEATGRSQLLSNSTVIAVCYLLNSFQNNAELLLNCVRVTAKLSQFEPFRAQLNKKPKYISFLANVIINEGDMCRRVMNADSNVSWPSWYTWPLLSRTAFTLGNLSTTNNSNRLLIANVCKCLMPLIILLQTCSCSLMHLYTSSGNTGDSDSEEGGGDDQEGDSDSDSDNVRAEKERGGSGLGTVGLETNTKETKVLKSQSSSSEFSTDKESSRSDNSTEGKHVLSRSNSKSGYLPSSFDQEYENNNLNINTTEDDGCAEAELNDATVKLLRLFANLTINESIGYSLAKRKDTSKMLLELLACSDSGSAGREELHLNVVAACTNLTFYSCRLENGQNSGGGGGSSSSSSSSGGVVLAPETVEDLKSLATRLASCLFHDNKEVVLESARALGNLTRKEEVIECLCANRAAEVLVLLLDHSDFEILIAVTGALVNISANVNSLSCLTDSHQPAQSLALIMRKASFKHLQLSTLVCQVFHNLLLHDSEGFDEVVRSALGTTLLELVDTAEDMIGDDDEEGEGEASEDVSESVQRYEQFVRVGRMVLDFLTNGS